MENFLFDRSTCGRYTEFVITASAKITLVALRLAMGWLFLYSSATKIIHADWSAAGYIGNAKTFEAFYDWLSASSLLPAVNAVNVWGQFLLALSLIFGFGVRLSSVLGALLMLLYYLPILDFPHPNPQSYIVDQHIVYLLILLFFAAIRAGRVFGLDGLITERVSWLKRWFG